MAEETTLKFQQVICPSCKRPINTFNPNKLMAECPYCHSKLINPLVKPKDIPMPSRIIPFSTTEKNFEKELVEALVKEDYVPTDIFEAISVNSVMQIYVPLFVYEGTYNASWNCQSAVEIDEKNTQWFPQSGMVTGDFSFLLLANESEDIPKELSEFTRSSSYDVTMSEAFEPDMIDYDDDNLMILECNTDAKILWEKYGKGRVNSRAKAKAMSQTNGQKTRNFNVSSSFNLTSSMGEFVLVPFWFVYYKYGDKQYHALMEGYAKMLGAGHQVTCTYPIDEEEKEYVKEKKKEKGWLSSWSVAPAMFFGLITFLYLSVAKDDDGLFPKIITLLVVLVVMKIGKSINNSRIDKQIEERLKESKAQRRAASERL